MRGLVRTRNGMMVHHQDCHMAKRGHAVPWLWADKVSADEVLRAVSQFGYRQCNRCRPLGRLLRVVLRG